MSTLHRSESDRYGVADMQDHGEGPSLEEMNRQRLPYVVVLGLLTIVLAVLASLTGVGVIS